MGKRGIDIMNNILYMTHALRQGELVHISDVDKGLNCNCICPSCKQRLVAKKGDIRKHHFAHRSNEECAYGYETSLHLLAKEIISKTKKFYTPKMTVDVIDLPLLLESDEYAKGYLPCTKINVDTVELEQPFNDIKPDIAITCSGVKLFVEIYVTHKCDDNKIKKIQNKNISAIEIDLSKIDHSISEEELTNVLINETANKKWIYNVRANHYKNLFNDIVTDIINDNDCRGIARKMINNFQLVTHCPLSGTSVIISQHCFNCHYCIDTLNGYDDSLYCLGKYKIKRTVMGQYSDIMAFLKDFENQKKLKR